MISILPTDKQSPTLRDRSCDGSPRTSRRLLSPRWELDFGLEISVLPWLSQKPMENAAPQRHPGWNCSQKANSGARSNPAFGGRPPRGVTRLSAKLAPARAFGITHRRAAHRTSVKIVFPSQAARPRPLDLRARRRRRLLERQLGGSAGSIPVEVAELGGSARCVRPGARSGLERGGCLRRAREDGTALGRTVRHA